jgi:putative restriction endonuclease
MDRVGGPRAITEGKNPRSFGIYSHSRVSRCEKRVYINTIRKVAMLWLEMSRDREHGGGDWGFTRRLWSPTKSKRGSSWAYWESVRQVRKGEQVLHLRGIRKDANFVGFSEAVEDGELTTEKPPSPGQWAYSSSFYRVELRNFQPFPNPVRLLEVFAQQRAPLEEYFRANKKKPQSDKRRLFYVYQAGRLQCLNGAYCSEVDEDLGRIIFGLDFTGKPEDGRPKAVSVQTGQVLQVLSTRIGQSRFSGLVLANYASRCCFPGCDVAERRFLRGGHIARWSDAPQLRGEASNGLCLCLMHDAAFESGLFTLDREFRVLVGSRPEAMSSSWTQTYLRPYEGKPIRTGTTAPSVSALELHWKRTGNRPG